MRDQMRALDSSAAFRDAIYRAVPFSIIAAFVGATGYYLSRWYDPHFARILFVVLAVSGFVATLSMLIGYYHRRVLLGMVAAVAAFLLPIVTVLASLRLAKIPLEDSPLWLVIPAGAAGEIIFKIIQKLHVRDQPATKSSGN